jgi:hypothetical protein
MPKYVTVESLAVFLGVKSFSAALPDYRPEYLGRRGAGGAKAHSEAAFHRCCVMTFLQDM